MAPTSHAAGSDPGNSEALGQAREGKSPLTLNGHRIGSPSSGFRIEILEAYLTTSDQAAVCVFRLDQPQLLRSAAVERSGHGGHLARPDSPEEVRVVVDPDHLSTVPQPGGGTDAGQGLDNAAVGTAVDDAVRLMKVWRCLPGAAYLVGRHLRHLETEMADELPEDVIVRRSVPHVTSGLTSLYIAHRRILADPSRGPGAGPLS
jgi:hypothetical protein